MEPLTTDRLPLGKTCTKCSEWKLLAEFQKQHAAADGRMKMCAECRYIARHGALDIKCCTKCQTIKSIEQFSIGGKGIDGRHSACKCCDYETSREVDAVRRKKWREENRDKENATRRLWRRKNAKRINAQQQEYRDKNLEEYRAYQRQWARDNPQTRRAYQEANRDTILARIKAWQEANPERTRLTQTLAQSRRRELVGDGKVSADEFLRLCEEYEHRCASCHVEEKLEADHVVPLSKGGVHHISNIQPLCRSCNARKGVQTIDYR